MKLWLKGIGFPSQGSSLRVSMLMHEILDVKGYAVWLLELIGLIG